MEVLTVGPRNSKSSNRHLIRLSREPIFKSLLGRAQLVSAYFIPGRSQERYLSLILRILIPLLRCQVSKYCVVDRWENRTGWLEIFQKQLLQL